uniref:Uncharacterized protein n=1 Tax=Kryptolebias marmoratus TaxID=37003 RepID=A0A3Q3B0M4_KRYMA
PVKITLVNLCFCVVSFKLRMEWLACSPDFNPTEHPWDQLGLCCSRLTNTTTLADFEEWEAIPQQCVTKLVSSMRRRRCQAVVAVFSTLFNG